MQWTGNVMNRDEAVAQALEDVLAEVRRLQMAEQVQKGMWTVLVRHLAASGHLDLAALRQSIEHMAAAQNHEDWQSLHADYLAMLDVLSGFASGGG